MAVPAVIAKAEFVERQAAARAATREAGFDALLICARGGGAVDRYGNVMYLTNFYSSFPFIPDRSPDWSARGHPFVLIPADGPTLLIVDMAVNRHDVQADDVIVADDMVPALVGALKERLPGQRRIGIAGADAVPWSVFRKVEQAAGEIAFVPADEILTQLRMIKSPAEIAVLRQASALGSRAIEAMMAAAQPGATHGQIMGVGLDLLAREGAILYNNFMSSGRGGNAPSMVYSDFPTWASTEPLEDGQWFQIGISGIYRGYYFDHSRSKPIGKSTSMQLESFEAAIACVQAGIAAIEPGATAGAVAQAGFRALTERGFSTKSDFSGLGHGIGLGWDSPWLVPDDKTVLQPGMVLCVERSVERQGYVGDFEETVLVTPNGCELLSQAPVRFW
jgi:Xaa-Pro aminopeptidase